MQTGVGCYQFLLPFSKNYHITPKWQTCTCRIGFTLLSSIISIIPHHTLCVLPMSCICTSPPCHWDIFWATPPFPFYLLWKHYYWHRYSWHSMNSIYFKVSLIKAFMCWLFSSHVLFLLEMGLNSNYEDKYIWTLHF